MKDFIKCFHRDSAGHWTCSAPCQITLPGGRIQVAVGTTFTAGTKFMEVDIAELLEREYRNAASSIASAPIKSHVSAYRASHVRARPTLARGESA